MGLLFITQNIQSCVNHDQNMHTNIMWPIKNRLCLKALQLVAVHLYFILSLGII